MCAQGKGIRGNVNIKEDVADRANAPFAVQHLVRVFLHAYGFTENRTIEIVAVITCCA